MQKKIIALTIAGLSATAFAQSNVTVYGVADVGYFRVSGTNQVTTNRIDSGGLAGSRIGFKGTEDLGNGLKTVFVLEYNIAMDANSGIGDAAGTSAGQNPWTGTQARQQYVGLSDSKFGTVVAGRLQTAGFTWACSYNPLAGGAFDAPNSLGAASLLACGTSARANNAAAYMSPSFGGLTFAFNHARLTEDATAQGYTVVNGVVYSNNPAIPNTSATDNSANLISATYANGPISGSVIWAKKNLNNTTAADSQTEMGLGGSYDFGVAKVLATYQKQTFANKGGADSKWALHGTVPVTSSGSFVVSYAQNNLNSAGVSSFNSKDYSLAWLQALSKRTTLYAGYKHISNDSNANLGVLGGLTPVAGALPTPAGSGGNYSFAPTPGGDSSIIGAGISHSF